MLAHPKLVPLLHRMVGQGYRMDHMPLLIAQEKGAEGFSLHGGPLTEQGHFNPHLQYRCAQGQIWNSLLAMSVVLTPHNPGDGGFCVVRGSHKLNFPVPASMMHGEAMAEHIYQPVTAPGDVVFFSEATVHGCLPWTARHQRRVVAQLLAHGDQARAFDGRCGQPIRRREELGVGVELDARAARGIQAQVGAAELGLTAGVGDHAVDAPAQSEQLPPWRGRVCMPQRRARR